MKALPCSFRHAECCIHHSKPEQHPEVLLIKLAVQNQADGHQHERDVMDHCQVGFDGAALTDEGGSHAPAISASESPYSLSIAAAFFPESLLRSSAVPPAAAALPLCPHDSRSQCVSMQMAFGRGTFRKTKYRQAGCSLCFLAQAQITALKSALEAELRISRM